MFIHSLTSILYICHLISKTTIMKNTLILLTLILFSSCVTNKLVEVPNDTTFSSLDQDK